MGFAVFVSLEHVLKCRGKYKKHSGETKTVLWCVYEGKREMKKSYHSPHLAGMKTAQISAQIQVASQIMPKYHQAHKSGVLKEAVGLQGVIFPSARNESIQQSL